MNQECSLVRQGIIVTISSLLSKDMIMEILSEEFPLSVKQILRRLDRYYNKRISCQAVHKQLKKMVFQKILVKEEHKYRISIHYIEQISSFLGRLKEEYQKRNLDIIEETGQETYSFMRNEENQIGKSITELVMAVKQRDSVLEEVHDFLQKFSKQQEDRLKENRSPTPIITRPPASPSNQ